MTEFGGVGDMRMSDWLHKPTTARVGGEWFHTVATPAAEAVKRLEIETTPRGRVMFALIALMDDPGCIEAHLHLATIAKNDQTAYSHLAKAVETGRQLWRPVAADQDDFAFWGVTATRPYMRAIAAFGDWHAEQGDHETAVALYGELLSMNSVDSQGIRYRLAELEVVAAPGM